MNGKPLTRKGSQWLFRMTASKSKPQNRWRPQRGGIRF